MTIKLAEAQAIVQGALAYGRAHDSAPLAVVVLDQGAHPVAMAREDGASLFRYDIALAKANGALGMGQNTRALAQKAQGNPIFFSSVSQVVGGRIAFSPGGVLIRRDSKVIGAIGISGDTGDVDEAAALAGLTAAGFATGEPA
jgi:uncharacterized protein GlcG (DUF336 family)